MTQSLNKSLNDDVETIHRSLITNTEYTKFLRATYDCHAIEGSLAADDLMAAIMIREYARATIPFDIVSQEKIANIVRALHVVMRRYGTSRKERRRGGNGSDSNFVVTPSGEVITREPWGKK